MDRFLNTGRWSLAAVGGVLTALLGGWDVMLKVLALFVVFDYLTGLAAAWSRKSLSSEIGARGIVKKVLLFFVVMVAAQIDILLASAVAGIPGFPAIPALCRSLVVCFYIANEGLSILENAGEAGVPIPHALMDALEQIRKKGDQGAEVPNTPS
ncbi:MAG: phage holin family protein [Bacillota bacterium]